MQSHLQWHLLSSVPTKPPPSLWSSIRRPSSIVYALNKDSSSSSSSSSSEQEQYDFDFDKDKARQALQDLDLQFQTMYDKQVPFPISGDTGDNLAEMEEKAEQVMSDYSGPFLPYMSIALVAFTIFYNILFYTVIKPSVDGPYEPQLASASAPAKISTKIPEEPVLQNPSPEYATQ